MINYEYIVEMYFESLILTPYIPLGYNRFDLFCDTEDFNDDDWACVMSLIAFGKPSVLLYYLRNI